MAWLSVKTSKGIWKVKPRWQARWAERTRQVRVIDLGLLLVVWWSSDDIKRFP
ncbi:hypothetical protein [Devosia sediminis]|uniref:Uncharacterized protein n=1 Tax=Devosia sediminis TaxID=2798801 RepID=A0A934MLP6_9HYPH|nr:hypothetical protein [Devosia sediminis]MBJ3785385.1 hypothetical protein [Devosia sediminis]